MPVKPPAVGKSRLSGLGDDARRDLAEAFALDTAQAAASTPGVEAVLVVTDDFRLAASTRAFGCEVMPDAVPVALCADLDEALVAGVGPHTSRACEGRGTPLG